ncbi:MAG: glycoside hydrolase family 3 C-terminal domain-containing protein [Acidobacteriaceae bacterium]|nr:glycoside hydrolase family 3 C-terminal domain-containing protein [Acidobacteriaceae bacterium]
MSNYSSADMRADLLVSQMTLDEKIQLIHGVFSNSPVPRGAAGFVPGIPRLNIPNLYFGDGSVGVGNNIGPATALPSSIAATATWDTRLGYEYGKVIGRELSAYGINVNLGGNTNMTAREPRDGRTFETKGEDPILAGVTAAAHLRGVQSQHIIGDIKHFAFNDQETERMYANGLIDDRGARESDLLAFEIGIKDSDVQSVMCAYNLVNSAYSCANDYLLNTVLKGDWGFQGFVMSDWFATIPILPAITTVVSPALHGLDQEQPLEIFFNATVLKPQIQFGLVPMSRVDNMVHRILRAMFAVGIFDIPENLHLLNTQHDQRVAQKVEEQGAVLLKNSSRQLPLNADGISSIAVIGSHADIGVLSGGGSAQVIPTGGPALTEPALPYTGGNPLPPFYLITVFGQTFPNSTACIGRQIWDPSSPLKAIQQKIPNATVTFDPGTTPGSAAAAASSADVAIVFVNQWEAENCDLNSLNLPGNQDELVSAVAGANPHTIVVLENGGPVVMPWLGQVSAVLEAWFPGQRGGEAIADILFGGVNPSGKLPLTFPKSVNDLPRPQIPFFAQTNAVAFDVNYSEGFLVGYKWYDAKNIEPEFPFGFGLSYSKFSFSSLSIPGHRSESATEPIEISFDVTNDSKRGGAEVAQVYLGFPASAGEAPKRLVGWQKLYLDPHETTRVTIEIDPNASSHPLSFWNPATSSWQTAPGDYTVYVGDSSRDISLTKSFTIGQ